MWLIEVKKEKAYWDEETTRESCEICAKEVYARFRPHTYLRKQS